MSTASEYNTAKCLNHSIQMIYLPWSYTKLMKSHVAQPNMLYKPKNAVLSLNMWLGVWAELKGEKKELKIKLS